MAEKCHRCGKSVYSNDNPQRIGGVVYHSMCFKCNTSTVKLDMNNAVFKDGEVYHKNSVPKDEIVGSAMDINTAHAMKSQEIGTKLQAGMSTGEVSSSSYIPDHIAAASKESTGMTGTRLI